MMSRVIHRWTSYTFALHTHSHHTYAQPTLSLTDTRTVDPDQEAAYYNTFATLNYVKYQPISTAGTTTIDYNSPNDANTALVCATGIHNQNFFLGMGTVNSHARVSHFGLQVRVLMGCGCYTWCMCYWVVVLMCVWMVCVSHNIVLDNMLAIYI